MSTHNLCFRGVVFTQICFHDAKVFHSFFFKSHMKIAYNIYKCILLSVLLIVLKQTTV